MTLSLALCTILNSALSVILTLCYSLLRTKVRRCAKRKAATLAWYGLSRSGALPRLFGICFAIMVTVDCGCVLVYTTRDDLEARRARRRRRGLADDEPKWWHCLAAACTLVPLELILAVFAWCHAPIASIVATKLGTHALFWFFYFRSERTDNTAAASLEPTLRRAALATALVKRHGAPVPRSRVGDMCVICQCDYESGDHVVLLPCTHVLHSGCAKEWWSRNPTCPICLRHVVPGEDGADLPREGDPRVSPRVAPEPTSPTIELVEMTLQATTAAADLVTLMASTTPPGALAIATGAV